MEKSAESIQSGKKKSDLEKSLANDAQQSQSRRNQKSLAKKLCAFAINKDAFLFDHYRLLMVIIGVILISSTVLLGIFFVIENHLTGTFTYHLIHTKSIVPSMPVHFAVVGNAGVGYFFCLVEGILLKLHFVSKAASCFIKVLHVAFLWPVFSLIYNFGSNIVFSDVLEDEMVSALSEPTLHTMRLWNSSQTAYICCGINSFVDWNVVKGTPFVTENLQNALKVPYSCCHKVRACVTQNSTNSFKYERAIGIKGCLHAEDGGLHAIVYMMLIGQSFQFVMMGFSLWVFVKINSRLRFFTKKGNWEIMSNIPNIMPNSNSPGSDVQYHVTTIREVMKRGSTVITTQEATGNDQGLKKCTSL